MVKRINALISDEMHKALRVKLAEESVTNMELEKEGARPAVPQLLEVAGV